MSNKVSSCRGQCWRLAALAIVLALPAGSFPSARLASAQDFDFFPVAEPDDPPAESPLDKPVPEIVAPRQVVLSTPAEDDECKNCEEKLAEWEEKWRVARNQLTNPATSGLDRRYVYCGQLGTFHLTNLFGTAHVKLDKNTVLYVLSYSGSDNNYWYFNSENGTQPSVWRFAKNDEDGNYSVCYGDRASSGDSYVWRGSICHCRITVKAPER